MSDDIAKDVAATRNPDRSNECRLEAEVVRLQGIIDKHELCHNLHGIVDVKAFAEGCAAEQRKLYGCAPDADEVLKLREQVAKLQAFKDWVHKYLDTHGVPHHPPGPHGADGCRIGDRMDWLMARVAELQKFVSQAYCVACDAQEMATIRYNASSSFSPMPELKELEDAARKLLEKPQ